MFDGEVKCGEEFLADGAFVSRTYVYIYLLANSLLQSLQYHTSCSQSMALGDVIGSIRLVGYTDSNGNHITLPLLGSIMDADADNPSEAPVARTSDTLVLTFVVMNPGRVPICQIQVDAVDSTRPDAYNPTPILSSSNGFNVGDKNMDNCLDTDETWLYTHSFVVVDDVGLGTGSSAVMAVDPHDTLMTDEDPVALCAHFWWQCLRQIVQKAVEVCVFVQSRNRGGATSFPSREGQVDGNSSMMMASRMWLSCRRRSQRVASPPPQASPTPRREE